MAKRKIKNMTRAEHKRSLERAVGLQNAAMRQMRGQVFLPKLSNRAAKDKGDIYARTVAAGKMVIDQKNSLPGSRSAQIISYYSREDVQQAMFHYAQGRKLCVLRTFHPMFGGSKLRKPEDILPLMAFYSQDQKLWPSIHGTVSRSGKDNRMLFDLVLEVDFKKSRARSFSLSRPIFSLLRDLGVDFRMKFSGNASPHIIIPAEAFPEEWRKISKCRNLYGKLLDFFRNQIKSPKTLDGSFRNPSHFLRMPYSLNENTGLVSLPMQYEDYERFAWEMARPETAVVMDDWWGNIPEDAPERTAALIEMAFGQRKVVSIDKNWDRDTGRQKQELLLPQMPDTLGSPVQMGMIKTGEGIAARGNVLMENPVMQAALHDFWAAEIINDQNGEERWRHANKIANKHGIGKDDMQILWHWSDKSGTLAHYSREEVQSAIFSYAKGRCIRMEGTSEYLVLNEPQDVFGLAAYMVGGGVVPAFRCTNAKYDNESGEMTACDMVIQVSQSLGKSAVMLLRSFNVPSFVLYNGGEYFRIVIPFQFLQAGVDLKSSLGKLPNMAEALEKHLRRMLKSRGVIKTILSENSMPLPYSIADDGERVNLPVSLGDVIGLTPDMANIDAANIVEDVNSFMPPGTEEDAVNFFKEIIF